MYFASMLNPFQLGDELMYSTRVTENDLAVFPSGRVHSVYSTFALGRDAEWACRLFVLQMKEDGEEGIGTFLNIRHKSPAKPGSQVSFIARLEEVRGNTVVCSWRAFVGDRLIAEGETGQKVLPHATIHAILDDV